MGVAPASLGGAATAVLDSDWLLSSCSSTIGYHGDTKHTHNSTNKYNATRTHTNWVEFVKCYHGGQNISINHSTVGDTVVFVVPLCSVYLAPPYEPNSTLLA